MALDVFVIKLSPVFIIFTIILMIYTLLFNEYGRQRFLPIFKDIAQAGLPLVQQYLFQFDRLVREHLPKLGEHFSEEMINPSMYASQWFITVFS